MDRETQISKFIPKDMVLDLSSDQEQDLEKQCKRYLEVQYFQGYFQNLSPVDQQQIIKSLPSNMSLFVQHSFLLHKSQLSIVLLGLKNNLNEYFKHGNNHNNQAIGYSLSTFTPSESICVIKKVLIPNTNESIELQKAKHWYFKQMYSEEKTIERTILSKQPLVDKTYSIEEDLIIEPFLGFGLASLMEYIKDGQISLQNVSLLFGQLVTQVKFLHERKIVHGDISCSNLLLLSTNKNLSYLSTTNSLKPSYSRTIQPQNLGLDNFYQFKSGNTKQKENSMTEYTTAIIEEQLQTQLKSLISELFDQPEQEGDMIKSEHSLSLNLIDLENSWVQDNSKKFTTQSSPPTQSINYRSPQALYERGSYPVDVWGLGLILLTLLTGQHLFPHQSQFTQKELQDIFDRENQFCQHIQTLMSRTEHKSWQNRQLYVKIVKTIRNCLNINPNQRPSVQQIAEQWI